MRLSLLIIGFLFFNVSHLSAALEGVRFYVEKDLAELKENPPKPDKYKKELNRILDLCKSSFSRFDTTTAKAYSDLSNIHFDDRNFKTSLSAKSKQLDILLHFGDKKKIADAYTQIAIINKWLASNYKVIENHLKAIEIKKQIPDHSYYANYMGLALAYRQIGKYILAKDYAEYALQVAKTPTEEGKAYNLKFLAHHDSGELLKAREMVEKALEIGLSNNLDEIIGSAYYGFSVILLSEQNVAERKLKKLDKDHKIQLDYSEAIKYAKMGIGYLENSNAEEKDRDLAMRYSSLSNLFSRNKQYGTSIYYADLSIAKLKAFYKKDYHPNIGTTYSNYAFKFGRRYTNEKLRNPNTKIRDEQFKADLDRQIELEKEALRCFFDRPNLENPLEAISEQDLYGVNLKDRIIQSYYIISLSYAFKYLNHGRNPQDLELAQKSEDKAIMLIDIMRAEMSDQDEKIFWRRFTRKHYDTAIELAEWSSDVNKMIFYIEKSKSVLLLDELNHKDGLKLIPSELAMRENKLREQIAISDIERPSRYNKYNKFIDSIKQEFPAYYEYKFDTSPPTLSEIQDEILDDSTNLVMYYATSDSLFTINITSTHSELLHAPRDKHLGRDIDTLLRYANNKDSLEFMETYEAFLYKSKKLHDVLFQPIKYKKPNTITIGVGMIQYIPFDLLVKEIKDGEPHFLIYDHVFSEVSSVSILRKKMRSSKNAFNNFLMVCPEKFDDNRLASLSESQREIRALKSITESKVLESEDASVKNFIDFSNDFDVIHFSSHSGIDSISKQPWIAFQDSTIDLNQIYKLNLNASLVTLSSCKSYSGSFDVSERESGEGINSLARAFLFADASAVIGSRWNLNEDSGLELFEDFYKNLKKSKSKPKALRDAKINFIKNNPYKSPYHWAPLVCIGNPQGLSSQMPLNFPWMFACIVLGIILIFSVFKIKNKSKV